MSMKKFPKKIAAAATLFAATMNLNGCVYGPPPEDYDEQQSIPYGYRDEYSPDINVNQNVYGPPPSMEDAEENNDINGESTNE